MVFGIVSDRRADQGIRDQTTTSSSAYKGPYVMASGSVRLASGIVISPPPIKYFCDYCGKGFDGNSKLEAHKRVHTGEKPFKCSQCEKAFARKGTLTAHMLTHMKTKFENYYREEKK